MLSSEFFSQYESRARSSVNWTLDDFASQVMYQSIRISSKAIKPHLPARSLHGEHCLLKTIMIITDSDEARNMAAGRCPNQDCSGPIHYQQIKTYPANCTACNAGIHRSHEKEYSKQMQLHELHLLKMKRDNHGCKI